MPDELLVVATYNAPHRLRPHTADFQQLADMGAHIICAQEHTDHDNWAPSGWRRFRPRTARSCTVYWDPGVVTAQGRGWARMSTRTFHELRGLTWVMFCTPAGPLRVASAHPPAFKTSRPAHAREYRRQMRRMADWLSRGPFRAIAGDINGAIPSPWTGPLSDAGDWSAPVPSGPAGQRIDYVGVRSPGAWQVTATRLGPHGRSDHRPVLATLTRR